MKLQNTVDKLVYMNNIKNLIMFKVKRLSRVQIYRKA